MTGPTFDEVISPPGDKYRIKNPVLTFSCTETGIYGGRMHLWLTMGAEFRHAHSFHNDRD